MTNSEIIRKQVLELCSEDDVGSWEIVWSLPALREKELIPLVADVVLQLIQEGRIVAKRKMSTNEILKPVVFEKKLLEEQLEKSSDPKPDEFYWFGISE